MSTICTIIFKNFYYKHPCNGFEMGSLYIAPKAESVHPTRLGPPNPPQMGSGWVLGWVHGLGGATLLTIEFHYYSGGPFLPHLRLSQPE